MVLGYCYSICKAHVKEQVKKSEDVLMPMCQWAVCTR